MTSTVRFAAPHTVEVVDLPVPDLTPGHVRVHTIASGVSAGTELTAYRGTNPYLTKTWDPERRVFHPATSVPPVGYPLDGWGYSEVGEVVEVAPGHEAPVADDVAVGDVVWGIWGHRGEAVLPAAALRGHRVPQGMDPVAGTFVRVGSIALNAVHAADAVVGSDVVIFGQGVIGLIATRLAVASGARVIAVDGIASRRERALAMGAEHALAPSDDLAVQVRDLFGSTGADAAIELAGVYPALQSATRVVGPDATVVASGFYQGEGSALLLGDEFHHNRVRIVASQISGVAQRLAQRWDQARLNQAVVRQLARKEPDATALVSHRIPIADAAEAYRILDTDPASALQVLLEF